MAQRDRAPLPALDRQTNTWLRGADPSSTAVQGLFSLTEYAPLQTPVPCFTHSVFHLSLLLFGYFSLALLSLFYISKADTMHTGRDTGERQYRVFTLVFVSDWFPCVFTDDLLGKRRSFSPNSSSECPSESKKLRSVSPKGRQCICVLWCYRCVKLFEGKKTEWLKRKDGSWLGRWWMSERWPQIMFLQICCTCKHPCRERCYGWLQVTEAHRANDVPDLSVSHAPGWDRSM